VCGVNGNPHLAVEPVEAGAPLGEARVAAVLVCGRNQEAAFMLEVAERLALPEVAYLVLTAAGLSWYPGRYWEPHDAHEPWLPQALEAVDATLERAALADRVVLVGFSQGGCVAAERLAAGPPTLDAAALLTASLIGPGIEDRALPPLDGVPVFLSTSEVDEWVRPEDVRATAGALERAGAQVTLRVDTDPVHRVRDAEVDVVRRLLVGA
jgi:predicted esterase